MPRGLGGPPAAHRLSQQQAQTPGAGKAQHPPHVYTQYCVQPHLFACAQNRGSELSQAGLVHFRQDGRFVIYSANFDSMTGLVSFLTENCCGGGACDPACQTAATPKRRKAA